MKINRILFTPLLLITSLSIVLGSVNASAKTFDNPPRATALQEKNIKLSKLIERVAKNTGKQFFVHAKCPAEVTAHGVNLDDINFEQLLTLLDLNFMASVEADGIISILPVDKVKQYAVPTVKGGESVKHGLLWVSKIIKTNDNRLNHMVPLLRSLVRTNGQMAYHAPSQSIILVAPYSNVIRIEKMIRELVETSAPTVNS